jgi:hypothetical protein
MATLGVQESGHLYHFLPPDTGGRTIPVAAKSVPSSHGEGVECEVSSLRKSGRTRFAASAAFDGPFRNC